MRFKIISVGWSCAQFMERTMASIEKQTLDNWDVGIAYDPSDDMGADIIRAWCDQDPERRKYQINTERRYAAHNQYDMIRAWEPEDDDVLVFLDLDGDQLSHEFVLERLTEAYAEGNFVTYGQYRPIPDQGTSTLATRYPPQVEATNAYRRHTGAYGCCFNHLRTMSARVFKAMPEDNFKYADGSAWYDGGPLRVDQRVATTDGWVAIGNLRPNDYVFGPDGCPSKVLGVYPQGELPMFRVRFSDHSEVICSTHHLWTVRAPGAAWRTLPLSQIQAEGLRCESTRRGWFKHRVPNIVALSLPEVDLPLDPYLLGYLLGDGGFTNSSPRITAQGEDLPWVKALPDGVGYKQIEKRNGFCPQYQLVKLDSRVRKSPNPLISSLRSVGLWGVSGSEKFIPDEFLWASASQRWALLQGLLDSDGTCEKTGASFSNNSLKLHEGVRLLVQSLGGLARTSQRAKFSGPNDRGCFNTTIQLDSVDPPFRLQRKRERWKNRTRPLVRSIVSIEPTLSAEAICIKVDRHDGLFLTEDLVPTHNTDYVFMLAALELSGGRYKCFDEVLLDYNHANPLADNIYHPYNNTVADFLARTPLQPLDFSMVNVNVETEERPLVSEDPVVEPGEHPLSREAAPGRYMSADDRRKVIAKYGQDWHVDILIETGTNNGDTPITLKHQFKMIHTIELEPTLYRTARARLSNLKHVHCHEGDSTEVLPQILKRLNEPAVIWLDGHCSGPGTARGDFDTPVVQELEALFEAVDRGHRHVILVDDARIFAGQPEHNDEPHYADYPTLDWIEELALKHDYDYVLLDDIVRLTPLSANSKPTQ